MSLASYATAAPGAYVPGRVWLERARSSVDLLETAPSTVGGVDRLFGIARPTEVSRLKGQRLDSERNAKLIATNANFMAYTMKNGNVRAIMQDGRVMLRLANRTQARIVDMALVTSSTLNTKLAPIVIIASADQLVTAIHLEDERTSESARNRKVEMEFSGNDSPSRVLAYPGAARIFATLHTTRVVLWNLPRVLEEDDTESTRESTGSEEKVDVAGPFRCIKATAVAAASSQASLPEGWLDAIGPSASRRGNICDAAFSMNGTCLLVLAGSYLLTWSVDAAAIGSADRRLEALRQLQQVSLMAPKPDLKPTSIRVLCHKASAQHCCCEVALVGFGTGHWLTAHQLNSAAGSPVGRLLQTVELTTRKQAEGPLVLAVSPTTPDVLAVASPDGDVVLLLPLARAWTVDSGLPLPYVQRLRTETGSNQFSILKAMPPNKTDTTIMMYRGHNFVRDKDRLDACNITVDEVDKALIVPAEAHRAVDVDELGPSPASDDEVTEQAPRPAEVPEVAAAGATPAEAASDAAEAAAALSPSAGGAGAAAEAAAALSPSAGGAGAAAEAAAALSPSAGGAAAAAEAGGSSSSTGARDADNSRLDWGLMRQCASEFVLGLEQRRGEMVTSIISEVVEVLKASGNNSVGDQQQEILLEQALQSIREARDAQVTSERSLASQVRKAADQWSEASSTAVGAVLQKELAKVSDSIAQTLAQQLMQSRRFCETLARAVQKSGGAATKQALETLKPPKQLQDVLGAAMGEALHESLVPVFKGELRSFFEHELAPMVEQRVGEMMGAMRDKMGECLDSIATEHEEAARCLGRDLAPVVAKELQEVDRRLAQRHTSGQGGEASGFSEEQLDELARSVEKEVVAPLHARIRELNEQVRQLREEARQLSQRWSSAAAAAPQGSPAVPPPPPPPPTAPPPLSTEENEKVQLRELERHFRENKVEDAFIKAMTLQSEAKHVDFVGRMCQLVPVPVADWLAQEEAPLSMPIKMLLMLSLAEQLARQPLPDPEQSNKVEWITEVFLNFDAGDESIVAQVGGVYQRLLTALDTCIKDLTTQNQKSLRIVHAAVRHAVRAAEPAS